MLTASLQRDKTFPMSVLDLMLNHLMVRFSPETLGECGVPLHCHYTQVHSELEW